MYKEQYFWTLRGSFQKMSPKETLSSLCSVRVSDQEKHRNVTVNVFSMFWNTYTRNMGICICHGWRRGHMLFSRHNISFFEGTIWSMKDGRLRKYLVWWFKVLAQLTAEQESLFIFVWSTNSVYTFINYKMCAGIKSGRQKTGNILSPGCLIKSNSFPMAVARYRIIRMCLYGAI